MRIRSTSVPLFALLVLPVAVATFDLSIVVASSLVVLILAGRWFLNLYQLFTRRSGPDLVLESIAASHYVEKVRWSLDRLGVEFDEEMDIGTLGVFFTGRTVPRLRIRTGLVVSRIGNSSDILRYLWGRYAAELDDAVAFLEPTSEALELERQLDTYGAHLQRWIYARSTPHGRFCRHIWGVDHPAIPLWQRLALRLLHPFQRLMIRRAFRISRSSTERSIVKIEELLERVEGRLAEGHGTLLGGVQISFVDLTFAALSGLWVWPTNYGGGRADPRSDSDRNGGRYGCLATSVPAFDRLCRAPLPRRADGWHP